MQDKSETKSNKKLMMQQEANKNKEARFCE